MEWDARAAGLETIDKIIRDLERQLAEARRVRVMIAGKVDDA